jgi:hypothetical protein
MNVALFRSECEKHIIILDCVGAMNTDGRDLCQNNVYPSPDKVDVCYDRLTIWWRARPASILPGADPSQENLLCS